MYSIIDYFLLGESFNIIKQAKNTIRKAKLLEVVDTFLIWNLQLYESIERSYRKFFVT